MTTHITAATPHRAHRDPGVASIRLAAVAGALFFVLILVHAQLLTGAPSATDPGRDVVDYISSHQGRFQIDAVVLGLAMPAALVWLSALARALQKAEGATSSLVVTALAGGVLAAAATVTGALIEGATATRIADLGAADAHFYWTLFLMSIGGTLLGLMLLIAVTAVVARRTGLFAHWFMVASVLLALVSLAGSFTIGYASDAIQVVAAIAVVLDSVWILLVSVFLWRDPGRALP